MKDDQRGRQNDIFQDIGDERDRQDAKWGGIPGVERMDGNYSVVLGEEFGEVCKADLECDIKGLRNELIQVAAVAVAAVEQLDALHTREALIA